MEKRRILASKLIAPIIALCILAGCAERQCDPSAARDSREIAASVGRDFVIILPSNPTTGYSWRLAEPLPETLELSGKSYMSPQQSNRLVGAAGVEEWKFVPLRKARTVLVFEYVRPWEKDKPPAKRETFTVNAR